MSWWNQAQIKAREVVVFGWTVERCILLGYCTIRAAGMSLFILTWWICARESDAWSRPFPQRHYLAIMFRFYLLPLLLPADSQLFQGRKNSSSRKEKLRTGPGKALRSSTPVFPLCFFWPDKSFQWILVFLVYAIWECLFMVTVGDSTAFEVWCK